MLAFTVTGALVLGGTLFGALVPAAAASASVVSSTAAPAPSPTPAIAPAATATAITTPADLEYGTTIVLGATVTSAENQSTDGTVTFTVNGDAATAKTVALVDGEASLAYGAADDGGESSPYLPAPGTLSIAAAFTPADTEVLAPSEASSTVTIRPASTTTRAGYSRESPIVAGSPAWVTAQVDHAAFGDDVNRPADISGTIEFYLDGALVATAPVLHGHDFDYGFAGAEVTPTAAGSPSLVAKYSGDSSYTASAAEPVALPVTVAPPSPAPTPSATPSPTPSPTRTTSPAAAVPPGGSSGPGPVPTVSPTPTATEAAATTPDAVAVPGASVAASLLTGPSRLLVLVAILAAVLLVIAVAGLTLLRLNARSR